MEHNTNSLTAQAEGNTITTTIPEERGTFAPADFKLDGRTKYGRTAKTATGYTVVTGEFTNTGYTTSRQAVTFTLNATEEEVSTSLAAVTGWDGTEIVLFAVVDEYNTCWHRRSLYKSYNGEIRVVEGMAGDDVLDSIADDKYSGVLASIAAAADKARKAAAWQAAADAAVANTPLSDESRAFLRVVEQAANKEYSNSLSGRYDALIRDAAMTVLSRYAKSIGTATGRGFTNEPKVIQYEDIATEMLTNVARNSGFGDFPRDIAPAVTEFIANLMNTVRYY